LAFFFSFAFLAVALPLPDSSSVAAASRHAPERTPSAYQLTQVRKRIRHMLAAKERPEQDSTYTLRHCLSPKQHDATACLPDALTKEPSRNERPLVSAIGRRREVR